MKWWFDYMDILPEGVERSWWFEGTQEEAMKDMERREVKHIQEIFENLGNSTIEDTTEKMKKYLSWLKTRTYQIVGPYIDNTE
jgi:hypothetical protein